MGNKHLQRNLKKHGRLTPRLELLEDRLVPTSAQSLLLMPLHFEANVGQTDAQVQFLARGQDYALFLTPTEAVLNLFQGDDNAVLRSRLVGSNPAAVASGVDSLPGKANYFVGNDPSQWHTDVATFGRVRFEDVYAGIDLVYYGTSQQQLEYDFIVAPGADPSTIRLSFQGADHVSLDAHGNLVLHTALGDVVEHAPVIYQERGGVRHDVTGAYVLEGNEVRFQVGAYDPTLPLVIDPILVYSTYLGGSNMDDALDVAVDNAGNAYVTGFTRSANFPTISGYDTSLAGSSDAFVSKLSPNGSTFIYSTYIGGSGRENDATVNGGTAAIALSGGNAYITGYTQSANFPTTANGVQRTLSGTQDAFIVGLNGNGNALNYGSYLGGTGIEAGTGIRIDQWTGNIYVAGWTASNDFPLQSAVQPTFGGGVDAFMARLAGSSLHFSTYIGGSGIDRALDLAIDASNNPIIIGRTFSSDFPATAGMDTALGGTSDAFVTKLNAAGTVVTFATYLGGSGDEGLELSQSNEVGGVAVDGTGNIFVTGSTSSGDFPTVAALDNTLDGTWDAFVTKFGSTGTVSYSTFLGGAGNDFGFSIGANAVGDAFVTGYTESGDFPTSNPTQAALAGTRDAFVTVVNAAGIGFWYSTYFGGNNGTEGEIGRGIFVTNRNQAYVVGFTDSTTYPTFSARQASFGGGSGDGFVARFAPLPGITLLETGSGPSTDVIEGNATDIIYVVLNSQPTANVVVTLDGGTQITSPAPLTFTPANWDTTITITVTALDDSTWETTFYHQGTITTTVASGDTNYDALVVPTITARITDNDTPGVYAWAGSFGVNEAGATSTTYRILLLSQPTADVFVTMSPDSQVTMTQSVLTFTPANWNTWQNVTVTAVDDGLVEGTHYGLITHAISSADSNYNTSAIFQFNGTFSVVGSASIIDNDTPGITVNWGGGFIVNEQGPTTSSYTIVLRSAPAADVIIAITPDSQITTHVPALTFTPANWNVIQRVTVTAVDDALLETVFYHTGVITHAATSADGAYNGFAVASATPSIIDNDTPSIFLQGTGPGTSVNEAGPTSDNYTLLLTSPPTADVFITLNPGTQLAAAPSILTFTPTNWMTPKNINVTAIDDGLVEGAHNGIVTHTVTSADPIYNGRVIPNITASITDNDAYSITFSQSSASTDLTESGATDSYTVVLGSQPSADVIINLSPNVQLSVIPSALTFTAANWNTSQTVVVRGVDDAIAEGPHTGIVAHSVVSTDTNYNGRGAASITANVTDNDTVGVILNATGGSTDVVEAGATDTVTVVLNSEPTANVTISLNTGTQLTVAANPITFTAANWNVPQTLTVTAVDDLLIEGNHSGTIAAVVTSADLGYNGLASTPLLASIIDDDYVPGILVTESGGSTTVAEAGVTDTYTVVLNSRPLANVVISFNPGTQVTVAPAPLTFSAANWNIPQTVLVAAVDDNVFEGSPHSGVIRHSAVSSDANYNGFVIAQVTATVLENDPPPGVNIYPSGAGTAVTEGGSGDTYTIALNAMPTATVVITLNGGSQLSVSPTSLIFTPTNWNTPQLVNVAAIDDTVGEATPQTGIVLHSATSADPNYNGISIAPLTADITDNDVPAVLITETNGSTTLLEGTTGSYTLRLNTQPVSPVVVTLNGDAQASASASTVTFTAGDWNIPRPIIVLAVEDGAAEGDHAGRIRHTVASSDPAYSGLSLNDLVVHVADNDGLLISGTPGNDQILVSPSADGASIQVSVNGKSTLFPASLTQILIQADAGNDDIQITTPLVPVAVIGGLGTDRVFATGQAGANLFTLGGNEVTVNGVGVNIWDVESLIVNGRGAADTFTVVSVPTFAVEFKGDLGSDRVIGPDRANLWAISGADTGTLDRTIKLNGIENLVGGALADSFQFAAAKAITGTVDGGAGNNILDFSLYTTPLSVNLATGLATGTGGFQNVTRILGGKGADQLIGLNQVTAWTITSLNSGDVGGIVTFAGFETLTGGTAADTFFLASTQGIKTRIDGGAGANVLNYSLFPGFISVNLQARTATAAGTFANIQSVVGSPGKDTLVGANKAATWTLTGTNLGTFSDGSASFAFTDVENLTGGTLSDLFRGDGLWTGLVNGGSGIDTLEASTSDHLWNITAANAGALDGHKFTAIENLQGGAGDDTFLFAANQRISGKIDGGAGADVLNLSAYLGTVSINLQTATATGTGGISNLEQFLAGSGKTDSLIAANRNNAWNLTDVNMGDVNGLGFAGFENLSGGTLADQFNIDSFGDWTGILSGGAGSDSLLAAIDRTNVWTTTTLNGRKFQAIEVRR